MAALVDRRDERAALERLLGQATAGQSGVLVIRGPAGTGKSALLEYTAGRAGHGRILRVMGMESEMELPFAALHQLCSPLFDGLPAANPNAISSDSRCGAGSASRSRSRSDWPRARSRLGS